MLKEFFRKLIAKKATNILNLSKNSKIEIYDNDSYGLGDGNYSTVSKYKLELKNKSKPEFKIKKREFVIKTFKRSSACDYSYTTYVLLKSLNFPTFTTYRKLSDKEILMTNYSTNINFCINPVNDESMDSEYILNYSPLIDIINFDNFLNSSIELIMKLSKNNIKISGDVFFFIGKKSPETELKLVIGDLDRIKFNEKNCFQKNMVNLDLIVSRFILGYINKLNRENYKTRLDEKFSQFEFLKNRNIKYHNNPRNFNLD